MRLQRAERNVSANADIANEVEIGRFGDLFEAFFAVLSVKSGFALTRRDAATHTLTSG